MQPSDPNHAPSLSVVGPSLMPPRPLRHLASSNAGLIRITLTLLVLSWACGETVDRSGLEPVPRPETDQLEASVQAHIDEARLAWEVALADGSVSASELAEPAAEYARVANIYELWPTAEAAYRNAVRLRPDDFETSYLFANFLAARGNPEEALTRLLSVRDQRPDFLPMRIAVLEAHLDLGDLEAARSEAEQGVALAPGEPGFHFLLGQILLSQAEWEPAIAALERTLEIAPAADAAHHGLASAHAALGDLERAQHHRELAGTLRPGIRDDILGALGSDSRNTIRYERRAQNMLTRGNARAAAALLLHARELAPTQNRINIALSVALNRLGQHHRAIEILEEYLSHDLKAGARAVGLVNLGHTKARLGLEEAAMQAYGEALTLQPNVPNGSLNLGTLMCRVGREPETALELLETAFVSQPDANAAIHLATCRFREEGAVSALTTLRAALADDRIEPGSHGLIRLAELRIELAREDLGSAAAEAALARADEWFQRTRRVEFLEMGIHALARLGRRDAALRNVDAALQAVVGAGRKDLQLRLETTQSRIVDNLPPLPIDPLDD